MKRTDANSLQDPELVHFIGDKRQELFNLRFRTRPASSRTPPGSREAKRALARGLTDRQRARTRRRERVEATEPMIEEEKNEQAPEEAPQAEEAPPEEAAAEEPQAEAPVEEEPPAEEPEPEPEAEEPAASEEPEAEAAAPATPAPAAEPVEVVHPKVLRKTERSTHSGEARPSRTPEERAAERAEARRARAARGGATASTGVRRTPPPEAGARARRGEGARFRPPARPPGRGRLQQSRTRRSPCGSTWPAATASTRRSSARRPRCTPTTRTTRRTRATSCASSSPARCRRTKRWRLRRGPGERAR